MTIVETDKDLFEMDCALINYTSSDFVLSNDRIGKQFKDMGIRKILLKSYKQNYWDDHGYCAPVIIKGRVIYNLVTKKTYRDESSFKTLIESLVALKKYINTSIIRYDEHDVAILNKNLDNISWSKIISIIEDLFSELDVTFYVCNIRKNDMNDTATDVT